MNFKPMPNDSTESTSMECHFSQLLNDEAYLYFPILGPSICKVDYDSISLEMLEKKLAANNQDKFIDLS